MTPEHIRQQQYRARRTAKLIKWEAALHEIIATLSGNDKPLATKVRTIAEEALS